MSNEVSIGAALLAVVFLFGTVICCCVAVGVTFGVSWAFILFGTVCLIIAITLIAFAIKNHRG